MIETKYDRAVVNAKAYVKTFGHLETKGLANSEGWRMELEQYVYQTALTQAAMIEGAKAPWTAPPHINPQSKNEVNQYVDYCRQQADKNAIHVPISKKIIEAFQKNHERKKPHADIKSGAWKRWPKPLQE